MIKRNLPPPSTPAAPVTPYVKTPYVKTPYVKTPYIKTPYVKTPFKPSKRRSSPQLNTPYFGSTLNSTIMPITTRTASENGAQNTRPKIGWSILRCM